MAIHSSTLAWEIPWTEGAWWPYSPQGHKELDMTEHAHMHLNFSATGFFFSV